MQPNLRLSLMGCSPVHVMAFCHLNGSDRMTGCTSSLRRTGVVELHIWV